MSSNVFSTSIDLGAEPELRARLEKMRFEFRSVNHAHWSARKDGLSVTLFKSGKLLIQGNGADALAEEILPSAQKIDGLEHLGDIHSWIGTDEAGKGDFFGPLVVAALHVEKNRMTELMLLEAGDSKKMNDDRIAGIATKIKKHFAHAIVIIPPHKYNTDYERYHNLNILLAQAHADAIEKLLKKVDCSVVLSDQFGDERLIIDSLGKRGQRVTLVQKTKAERNPGVAGASILARNAFVSEIDKLGKSFGLELPKGASQQVISAGKAFVEKHGQDKLARVAKLHFKTAAKIHD
jgi:ribonuclease HIII